MLFDTQIKGLMGSPRMAGSTRRLSSAQALDQFRQRPAPATRAANLALRQRLRVEIVFAAINRRAGEPRDPRHTESPPILRSAPRQLRTISGLARRACWIVFQRY